MKILVLIFSIIILTSSSINSAQSSKEYGLRDESFHFQSQNAQFQQLAEQQETQDTQAESDVQNQKNQHEDLNGQDDAESESSHSEGGSQHHYLHPGQLKFWINALIATILTCIGGFCSGMTVGLMSIQTIQLQIMSLSKDEQQKKIAKRILSVLHDHHLFLVTLLLANAMALQTLPLIVHSLMPDWAAIIFSTIIVLIVGQIVPQAYCTGPKKIQIAYYASPIILVMIKVLWILAYPMGKGLDYLLGKHQHQRIQHKDFANFLTGGSQVLKPTEKLLLTSILQLRTDRVTKIMVPIDKVYMLSLQEKLTPEKIAQINKKDYSYLLVYTGNNRSKVVGVIKSKQFALQYVKKCKNNRQKQTYTVEDFFKQNNSIMSIYQDTNLLEMLMLFQAKSDRFALVIDKKKKIKPDILSIMYSKSDMIAQKQQGQIVGVIFLYQIFEEIAEYNEQMAKQTAKLLSKGGNSVQLKQIKNQLKRPLIQEER